jgi:hypothetical protein
MKIKYILPSLALAAICATPSFAAPITYSATLSGLNESTTNVSAATGFETLSLMGDVLTINATFSGLAGPATGAHIHCCAPIGTDAKVAVVYSLFPKSTSGTFSQMIDLSTFAFSNGLNETTFLAGLNSGQAYANIHDDQFKGGEIEGQFAPTPTPEPSSLLLVATGLVGAFGAARRKLRA